MLAPNRIHELHAECSLILQPAFCTPVDVSNHHEFDLMFLRYRMSKLDRVRDPIILTTRQASFDNQ